MSKLFLVLDTETTGLDPNEDFIVEIAWQIIDENLDPATELRSFIPDHGSNWTDVFHRIRSNDAVRAMHQASGLAGDLVTGELTSFWKISNTLKDDIDAALSGRDLSTTVHLTGLSVHFDREMILASEGMMVPIFPAPGGADKFGLIHHRLFDLSSVKILFDLYEVPWVLPNSYGKHRAVDDVWETISQLAIFGNVLEGRKDLS